MVHTTGHVDAETPLLGLTLRKLLSHLNETGNIQQPRTNTIIYALPVLLAADVSANIAPSCCAKSSPLS